MNALYQNSLKRRISFLTKEFRRLETKRDEVMARSAATVEQKHRRLSAYSKLSGELKKVEYRLHHARRLLVHAQGDEYRFHVA